MDEPESDTISKEIKLEADEEYTEEISLTAIEQQRNRIQSDSFEEEKIYEKHEINGVPAIKLRSFHLEPDKVNQLDQFLLDAWDLRGYDQLIIDLRFSEGGSSEFVEEWFQNFTGRYIDLNQVEAHLRTEVSYRIMKNGLLQFGVSAEQFRGQRKRFFTNTYSPVPSHWSEIKITTSQKVENDKDIIVLINEHTRSAAEYFVRYLTQLENTTLIGSNTNGALLVGKVSAFRLNNSGIDIWLGTGIQIKPDLKNREGRGYIPDYWMEFSDDLENIDFNKLF